MRRYAAWAAIQPGLHIYLFLVLDIYASLLTNPKYKCNYVTCLFNIYEHMQACDLKR